MVQLNEIIGNKKTAKILQFFINNTTIEISQTEIIKKTAIAKATAVKWMRFLLKNNLLNCKTIGVSNLYWLNNDNLVVRQLKIANTILSLQELKLKDAEIYLYGSSARGEDTEKSDIDLLLISKLKRNQVVDAIDLISKKINRKISFKIFNSIEWSMMQNKDKAYYERVEKDKLRLI